MNKYIVNVFVNIYKIIDLSSNIVTKIKAIKLKVESHHISFDNKPVIN